MTDPTTDQFSMLEFSLIPILAGSHGFLTEIPSASIVTHIFFVKNGIRGR